MAITPVNFSQLASAPNASTAAPTPTPETGVKGFIDNDIVNPVKNAFSGGINQIQQGASEIGQGEGVLPAVGSALKIGAGIVGAASSPLAPVIQPTLGAASNAVSNKISDNPSVQKFAMSPAGQTTAKVAERVSNAGQIAGGIAGAGEVAGAASNIWDKVYNTPSGVDAATTARDTAAQTGVQNLQNMTETVGDYKNDLGTQFKQGAADIEKTNPNLKLNLTPEQLDALNTLKNNKSFALPDYLRPSSSNFGNGNIDIAKVGEGNHSGISLSPTQTQDLITQLNKSTFMEKSSGLSVDQSKIGLTNEIKSAANNTFGDQWKNVYSQYAKGAQAVDKISDIVNLDKNATPTDVNKSLNSVLKLSKTPEGKIILQNAVDEFKNASGIDLTNPTQAIGQILDKDTELQKAVKGGLLKQAFNPTYLAHLGIRIAAMSTIGYILRNQITGVVKSIEGQ